MIADKRFSTIGDNVSRDFFLYFSFLVSEGEIGSRLGSSLTRRAIAIVDVSTSETLDHIAMDSLYTRYAFFDSEYRSIMTPLVECLDLWDESLRELSQITELGPEYIRMSHMIEIPLSRYLGPLDIPISDESIEGSIYCRPMISSLTSKLRYRHVRMFEECYIDHLPFFLYAETIEKRDIFFHMYYF
jgi:hypothetical protein